MILSVRCQLNTIQITWEEGLNEGLSGLCRTVGVPLQDFFWVNCYGKVRSEYGCGPGLGEKERAMSPITLDYVCDVNRCFKFLPQTAPSSRPYPLPHTGL